MYVCDGGNIELRGNTEGPLTTPSLWGGRKCKANKAVIIVVSPSRKLWDSIGGRQRGRTRNLVNQTANGISSTVGFFGD